MKTTVSAWKVLQVINPGPVSASWQVPAAALIPQPITFNAGVVSASWSVPVATLHPAPVTFSEGVTNASWNVPSVTLTGGGSGGGSTVKTLATLGVG